MIGKASTLDSQRATLVLGDRPRPDGKETSRVKARILLVVLLILVLAVLGGVGYLGLNPPNPAPQQVQKTIPNDKFQAAH